MSHRLTLAAVFLALAQPVLAQPSLPPAATRTIDFAREVKPILQVGCMRCHGRGNDKGGFSLDTRDLLVKGGDTGPAIVPGKSADSFLIALVAGLDPDKVMPHKGSRLTAEQVGVLRAWIDQGAAWDPAISFARTPPANLARRVPPPPESRASPESTHSSRRISRVTGRHGCRRRRPDVRPAGDTRRHRRAAVA